MNTTQPQTLPSDILQMFEDYAENNVEDQVRTVLRGIHSVIGSGQLEVHLPGSGLQIFIDSHRVLGAVHIEMHGANEVIGMVDPDSLIHGREPAVGFFMDQLRDIFPEEMGRRFAPNPHITGSPDHRIQILNPEPLGLANLRIVVSRNTMVAEIVLPPAPPAPVFQTPTMPRGILQIMESYARQSNGDQVWDVLSQHESCTPPGAGTLVIQFGPVTVVISKWDLSPINYGTWISVSEAGSEDGQIWRSNEGQYEVSIEDFMEKLNETMPSLSQPAAEQEWFEGGMIHAITMTPQLFAGFVDMQIYL